MNTKLHAVCDSQGRPISLFATAGQVSDYIGARALLSNLPNVDWLLGDRGYDADWYGIESDRMMPSPISGIAMDSGLARSYLCLYDLG